MNQANSNDWTLVCHLNYGGEGKIASIKKTDSGFNVVPVSTANASEQAPVFLGVDANNAVVSMDQLTSAISHNEAFSNNSLPDYAYPDYANQRLWFVNDGDKENGNDPVFCDNNGSPITVVDPTTETVLARLCAGRGHHVAAFVPAKADRKALAYVSNLLDGNIIVLGNDKEDSESFLKVLTSINLCESEKEKDPNTSLPNNAFPHGLIYSSVTDRVYNLNNGYGTIAVINPNNNEIENRIGLKKCSNILLSPNQRYAIGKGADRKSNPEHVMGRISVVDLEKGEVAVEMDVEDVYPSTYRFNPSGSKLYVTTAATGKGDQKSNLKMNKVLVYDTSNLPNISLIKEIEIGLADCGRRPIAYTEKDGDMEWIFIPNPTDGTLTILDGSNDAIIDTVSIGEGNIKEVLFSFWDLAIKGS